MEIRKITEKERRPLMDLYRYAFTEWSDQAVKDEELDEIVVQETLGLFENGRLVSSLRVHDFLQSVRGIVKDCGGVAGIATYPEARHKGYARQLMIAGFQKMHDQGQSVSMLDPFKESFYTQFGYVSANAPYLVQAPLKTLKHTAPKGSDWTFERVRAVNVMDEVVEFTREVGLTQYHGYITFKTLSNAMWKQRVKDSQVVFVKRKGKIQALSRYRIKGERRGDRWQTTMTVIDSLWRTRDARMALFHFFAQHQDQIDEIIFHAPFETKVEHWFRDVRLKVERKTPWMVRVVDAPKAVEKLTALGEDLLVIQISDPDCSWNNGIFTLQSEKSRLSLTKSSGKPIVKLSISAFSALVFGTLSLEELEYQEEITISEPWARHTLQRWFPELSVYNVVYF